MTSLRINFITEKFNEQNNNNFKVKFCHLKTNLKLFFSEKITKQSYLMRNTMKWNIIIQKR